MKTVIVYADKTTADTWAKEIAALPVINEDDRPVAVWYGPSGFDDSTTIIRYNIGGDGRCAQGLDCSQEQCDWLRVYTQSAAGVQVLDTLPADWQG